MPQTERIAITKTWLGRKGPQIVETLTLAEQERGNITEGLFNILVIKFKPQYNETRKSLKFRKLLRQGNENVEG